MSNGAENQLGVETVGEEEDKGFDSAEATKPEEPRVEGAVPEIQEIAGGNEHTDSRFELTSLIALVDDTGEIVGAMPVESMLRRTALANDGDGSVASSFEEEEATFSEYNQGGGANGDEAVAEVEAIDPDAVQIQAGDIVSETTTSPHDSESEPTGDLEEKKSMDDRAKNLKKILDETFPTSPDSPYTADLLFDPTELDREREVREAASLGPEGQESVVVSPSNDESDPEIDVALASLTASPAPADRRTDPDLVPPLDEPVTEDLNTSGILTVEGVDIKNFQPDDTIFFFTLPDAEKGTEEHAIGYMFCEGGRMFFVHLSNPASSVELERDKLNPIGIITFGRDFFGEDAAHIGDRQMRLKWTWGELTQKFEIKAWDVSGGPGTGFRKLKKAE